MLKEVASMHDAPLKAPGSRSYQLMAYPKLV